MGHSSDKEYEAANILLPVQNTPKVRAQIDRIAGITTQAIGLPTMFGNWSQHFYTVRADGGKIYTALSTSPTGTIDIHALSQATGVGLTTATGVSANGWPLVDGEQIDGNVLGGQQVGITGTTQTLFNQQMFLLYRTASGVGSAYVRVRRNSVGSNAGMEEFYPPGWKRGNR